MSDEITIGPEPVGPAPTTPPAEAPAPEPADQVEPDTFDRAYVQELRQEAAKYRTQLREVETRFEGLDPDEQALLAEFARLSKRAEAGDEQAAADLAEMLGIEPDQGEPDEPAQPVYDDAYFRRIAREEAERITSDRDMTSRVEQIQNTARSWGFTVTPGETGYDRYQRLCYIATNEIDPDTAGGDLMGAAKMKLEAEEAAYRQQIITDYLEGKGAATERSPLVANATGAAPQTRTPMSFEEAREALHQRLLAE